jgi:hypothetical protein
MMVRAISLPGETTMRGISVGSIAIAKRATGVCDVGEVGVCYEVYTLDSRPGYSFIFESGRYDGFSPDEVETMLELTGLAGQAVAGYQFRNVMQLSLDYDRGLFDAAFAEGRDPTTEAYTRFDGSMEIVEHDAAGREIRRPYSRPPEA